MEKTVNYAKLVKKAQAGDKECLNQLAKVASERLRADVYRLTLEYDLTQEIVQETLLEMFKLLGNLREANRFWPWLYKIALNKVRFHYRSKQHRKTVPISALDYEKPHKGGEEAMANLLTGELREIVFRAMRELKPRQRTILTLRCYREMEYSVIGELMGCSEFAAKMLFYRAKKSLKKELVGYGFGRGSLMMALILFGRLTAPSKVAAAEVSVAASSLKVGMGTALAGAISSKAAIVTLATAGVVTVGGIAVSPVVSDKSEPVSGGVAAVQQMYVAKHLSHASSETWYYYPSDAAGVVMIRSKSSPAGKGIQGQWMENDQANYYKINNTIYINNYRMWRGDLGVRRLPTDSVQLTNFISNVAGRREPMKYVRNSGGDLFVVVNRDPDGKLSQMTYPYDVLNEEYFRYDWLTGAQVVDNRDLMHRRGWTYFTISGKVNGKGVSGAGRIPFVYAASKTHPGWLKMRVEDGLRFVDSGAEADIYGTGGKLHERYSGGSFFYGLCRPWMGLHTIDTIRRDGAKSRMHFETKVSAEGSKAEVVLTKGPIRFVYTIDMMIDVVEKIIFTNNKGTQGELRFTYLQDIEAVGKDFTQPKRKKYRSSQRKKKGTGLLWLLKLAEECDNK